MQKLIAAICTLFFITAIPDQQPVVTPPSPIVPFRTRLIPGDPDRNWTCLFAADGSLGPDWRANGKPYQSEPIAQSESGYDASYYGVYTVPNNTPAGVVIANCDRDKDPEVKLTIQAPIARESITCVAGIGVGNVQVLLDQGIRDITLSAGLYTWDRFVSLPANTIIRGYGAIIRRTMINSYDNHYPIFFIAGENVSLYGMTFFHDKPDQVLAANPTIDGLVVADCTIKRDNLGFFFTHSLIRDCKFDGGGMVICPTGMILRCTFTGPSEIDPLQIWSNGPCGVIDCHFIRTRRGPVFQAQGLTISDFLFVGVECHDIVTSDNKDECWLSEGGFLQRMVCLHCRVRGCESATFQLDGGADQIFVRDFYQDGGSGPMVGWNSSKPVTNFVLQDFQLSRCGFYAGTACQGAKLIDGSVINFQPTRGSQSYQNPSPKAFNRITAVWAEGPFATTNKLIRVPVIGLASGFVPVQSFVQSSKE